MTSPATPSLPDALRAKAANFREIGKGVIESQNVIYDYCADQLDKLADEHAPALEALLREREWRPIESAPKDGTRILLGRPDEDGDDGISVCGYWIDALEDGADYMGNDGGFTDTDYQVFQPGRSFGTESYRYIGSQPTHWMPLPAGPKP